MSVASVLSNHSIKQFVSDCLREENAAFDYGSYIFGVDESVADLIVKEKGILAGSEFVTAIFKEMGCTISWKMKDGNSIETVPTTLATITGSRKEIFRGQNLSLNILSRASGIATFAKRMSDKLVKIKWNGRLTGTTRTTPGFRLVEKYALLVGGVDTSRYDWSALIVLDENHISSSGSIEKAVGAAREVSSSMKVAVVCSTESQAEAAGKAGSDIVIFSNMQPKNILLIAKAVKTKYPKILIEVTGSITEDNILTFALPQVDIIACHRLCEGYDTLDMCLKLGELKLELTSPDKVVPVPAAVPSNGVKESPKATPVVQSTTTPVAASTTKPVTQPVVASGVKRPATGAAIATPQKETPGKQDSMANKRPRMSDPLPANKTPSGSAMVRKTPPIRPQTNRPQGSTNANTNRFNNNNNYGNQQQSNRNFSAPNRGPQQAQFRPQQNNAHQQRPQGAVTIAPNAAVNLVRMVAAQIQQQQHPMIIRQQRPDGMMVGGRPLAQANRPGLLGNSNRMPGNHNPPPPRMGAPGQQGAPRPPMGRARGMFCTRCGVPNHPGAAFCQSCRNHL